MKKKPRFFCDNCGAEVPIKAKKCPGCGRFFASVRCPSCGYSGGEDEFKSGCPACGYSVATNVKGCSRSGNLRFWHNGSNALPVWVYILCGAIFTALMGALVFWFF